MAPARGGRGEAAGARARAGRRSLTPSAPTNATQYTCFFKDPSGNNLEFKAMTRPENLFNREGIYD